MHCLYSFSNRLPFLQIVFLIICAPDLGYLEFHITTEDWALSPLLGKRSSKMDPFTPPNFEDNFIICIYLTLFNMTIPKNFQPRFTRHNFIPLLDFLSMQIQNFF